MKRLCELESDDPTLQQAQRLLSTLEPLTPSPERMQRVRRAMEEKRAARSANWRVWIQRPRALGLAALLLLGGGSTLAAAQSGALAAMIARVARVVQLTPAAPQTPEPTRPAAKRAAPAARERAPQPVLPPVVAQPEAPPSVQPAPARTPALAVRHNARAKAVQARADNEAVRRAVKALRRDGDPALAARLLEEAHHKSPDGALAEEVMALRVEAALASGDTKARSFAREYLARYPQGRYRSEVERALR